MINAPMEMTASKGPVDGPLDFDCSALLVRSDVDDERRSVADCRMLDDADDACATEHSYIFFVAYGSS